jgi:DNA-directed RNA polymerase specialized sigma24 family protein
MVDAQYSANGAFTKPPNDFVESVTSHINWVYALCRRGLGRPALAAKATKATFLLHLRQSRALGWNEDLADWLFKAARFAVTNTARLYGSSAGSFPVDDHLSSPYSAVWGRIAPVLDESVSLLTHTDRKIILARYYEHQDLSEIARRLAIPYQSARQTVSSSTHALASLLANRRIVVSDVVLAGLLSARTSIEVPKSLALRTLDLARNKPVAADINGIAQGAMLSMERAAQRLLAAVHLAPQAN